MPKVAVYQGGAIARQGLTEARLRPVDAGEGALGAGLKAAGKALGDFAVMREKIETLQDENDAKSRDLNITKFLSAQNQRMREEGRGINAGRVFDEVRTATDAYIAEQLQGARSDRARELARRSIETRRISAYDNFGAHVFKETEAANDALDVARSTSAMERALDVDDEAEAETIFGEEFAEIHGGIARRKGLPADVTAAALAKERSAFRLGRANRMIQGENYAGAIAYADSHRGELSDSDYDALHRAVKGPLDHIGDEDSWGELDGSSPGSFVGGAGATTAPKGFDAFYGGFLHDAEGGGQYVPNDGNGHPAKYGINQGANPDIDVKNLTEEQARKIYLERYWGPSGAENISNPALAAVHVDTHINQGGSVATRLLAQAGGDPKKYLDLRRAEYEKIGGPNLKGWLNRLTKLEGFIGKPAAAEVPVSFSAVVRSPTVTVDGGRYGAPRDYDKDGRKDDAHVGVDLAGDKGTPLYPGFEGVARVSYSESGGNTVEVVNPSGWKMRILHLDSVKVKDGQEVGANDVLGGMGETGTSANGVHAHVELFDPSGKRVDPTQYAGPALPGAAGGTGGGGALTSAPDEAALRGQIDARTDWSPAKKARMKALARERVGLFERTRANREQEATRALGSFYDQRISSGAGPVTNLSQIPEAIKRDLPPGSLADLNARIQADTKPAAPKPNSPLHSLLMVMAADDPNSFLKRTENPEIYRGVFTDAEVETLHTMRQDIAKNAGAQPSSIISVFRHYSPVSAIPKGPNDKKAELKKRMDEEGRMIARVSARIKRELGSKPVTGADLHRIVKSELAEVYVEGQGMTPYYQAFDETGRSRTGARVSVDLRVPSDIRARVESVLVQLGQPNTPRNRAALYHRYKGTKW